MSTNEGSFGSDCCNTVDLSSKYSWTADLVWRNRSFKHLHVFYDQIAGQLGFSKTKSDPILYSVKFPEKCYGISEAYEEHLVTVHIIDRFEGLEPELIQSQSDILYFYLSEDSEVDRFRIVLSNALQKIQMKKRFLVLLNRESGKGRAGNIYEGTVMPMLQIASASYILKESEYNRHISLFATQFDASSIDGIILIGGDGTVNEFINGYLNRKDFAGIHGNLPITIVACGIKLQLASRFALGDAAMAVFSALRGKTYKLYPIAFVQARRRFYGHSYLRIKPKKRTYIKLLYLNTNNSKFSFQNAENDSISKCSTVSTSTTDSIVSKGPVLQYYSKFTKLDSLTRDISTSTAAFGPNSDLQLTNTFDPSQNHPLALMSQSNQSNPLNKIWKTITCSKFFSSAPNHAAHDAWPRLLAMTKAGLLQIEDTTSFPPSQNKDRWYVDGEIIGTESVYFESLETPILLTVPPDYIIESKEFKK